jgi:hypothetical protein
VAASKLFESHCSLGVRGGGEVRVIPFWWLARGCRWWCGGGALVGVVGWECRGCVAGLSLGGGAVVAVAWSGCLLAMGADAGVTDGRRGPPPRLRLPVFSL